MINSNSGKILTFYTKGELLAFSIDVIKEILSCHDVTPMPLVPKFIYGVVNRRGVVLPVIDLAYRLHQNSSEIADRSCILVIDILTNEGIVELGILVDSVSAIIDYNLSDTEEIPQFGSKLPIEMISKVINYNDRFVVILNEQRVFDVDEMADLIADFEASY